MFISLLYASMHIMSQAERLEGHAVTATNCWLYKKTMCVFVLYAFQHKCEFKNNNNAN